MSEAVTTPPVESVETKRASTVYFIDDSATMREVIKIAFRRENINVITCADATSAMAQFEQHPPDVVITDVIMPDQDGYSVCSQIKQNPQFSKTPVILMSGVVNKTVADRAVAVQADELVRKPFQPHELIGRVKPAERNKSTGATRRSASDFVATGQPVCASAGCATHFPRCRRITFSEPCCTACFCRSKASGKYVAACPDRNVFATSDTRQSVPDSYGSPRAAHHLAGSGPSSVARRNLTARTARQKTADRTANRAAVQSGARAARTRSDPNRIAHLRSTAPGFCRPLL
jgi:CheY-like chemotaxis protein